MKVPLSWLKEFVDITLPIPELAERLTLAGLEVGKIHFIGVEGADLVWERDKLLLGHILKVEQHPNADKLVLATVDIGAAEPETVVTGAPNLQPFVGQGDISHLGLKSPFVLEGATVYDGHADTPGAKMKLKGRTIRGIMNRHMLCSEKELGLSDDHEGIILTADEAAAPGTPLVDIWGDVVLEVDLTPNLVRCASVLGVAREVAAMTGQKVRYPQIYQADAGQNGVLSRPPLSEKLVLETTEPELNPRFVAILVEGIKLGASPYWLQRRLRLAGMRPINNIVDISNYVMLEMGQPNHAFDWDVLQQRAADYTSLPLGGTEGGQNPVKIITRLAEPQEKVLTLDGKTHAMPDFAMLVTDPKGNLSIGGIMGGGESEVSETSQNILLEAAAWNFINIRRTSQALNIHSEAGYRFSRGIHPAQAMFGALRGAQLLVELTGGQINDDPLDYYPNPAAPVVVDLPRSEVSRMLGVELSLREIKHMLELLEFQVELVTGETKKPHTLRVTAPDHRLDISADPAIGRADLIEEIARVYGYDRIPVSEIADELPPQRNNFALDREEKTRDLLVQLGLQEVITYRLTTPEAEQRVLQGYAAEGAYVTLANPSTPERRVMRHSLLNSVLEVVAENSKYQAHISMFEVGHIYLPLPSKNIDGAEGDLPQEQRRLAIVMTGPRAVGSWQSTDHEAMDFFDLKGIVEALLDGLHGAEAIFIPTESAVYYPGRVAELVVNGQNIGLLGQLHPLLVEAYNFQVADNQPVLAADFDLDLLLNQLPDGHITQPVSRFPAVQQDIALVLDETVSADRVLTLINQSGKPLLLAADLFDVFRGEQLGAGKKSLAYRLTYQATDRTLNDKEVSKQQEKIIQRLEREVGAKLRG